jgi:hypothetical protein
MQNIADKCTSGNFLAIGMGYELLMLGLQQMGEKLDISA